MVHLWGLHPLQGTAERVDAGNITYLRGVLFCFFLQLPWSNKWLPPTVPNSLCRSLNLNHTLSSLRDYSGWLYGWSCFLVLASILYLLVIKRLYLPSCGLWGVLQYCQTWQKKRNNQTIVCLFYARKLDTVFQSGGHFTSYESYSMKPNKTHNVRLSIFWPIKHEHWSPFLAKLVESMCVTDLLKLSQLAQKKWQICPNLQIFTILLHLVLPIQGIF